MDDLKALVTLALEKKGVFGKIRAELRASVFEAIEDSDRGQVDGGNAAVIGRCSEQAKALHATKTGQILTALVSEYLEWAGLDHTLRVYLPESNLPSVPPRRAWLEEEVGIRPAVGEASPRPLLYEVLNSYLLHQSFSEQSKGGAAMAAPNNGGAAKLLSRNSSPSRRPASPLRGQGAVSATKGNKTPRSASPVTSRGSGGGAVAAARTTPSSPSRAASIMRSLLPVTSKAAARVDAVPAGGRGGAAPGPGRPGAGELDNALDRAYNLSMGGQPPA